MSLQNLLESKSVLGTGYISFSGAGGDHLKLTRADVPPLPTLPPVKQAAGGRN